VKCRLPTSRRRRGFDALSATDTCGSVGACLRKCNAANGGFSSPRKYGFRGKAELGGTFVPTLEYAWLPLLRQPGAPASGPSRAFDPVLKILLVAYHFPPIGGAGVQRAVKLARYLPEFGIRPVVLTGPGPEENRWTPDDASLLAEVGGVDVVRVPGPPPVLGPFEQRTNRILGRRGAFIQWWIDSIVRVGREHGDGVALVVGELGPYETAFGVAELARALGVPWVAELQDPWALDEMWLYPSVLHRAADRRRMRSVLRTAVAVVMNTPEAVVRLRQAFPEFRDRLVVSIPNGFDADDFDTPPPERADGVFRIVHGGSLHTDAALRLRRTRRLRRLLGGMPVPEVDMLTRSHIFLLEAVESVLRSDPALRDLVELHLVGTATEADRAAAATYPFVRFHGYRSHAETISMLRSADLLFLPMQDLPPGLRAGLVPAKTYEYMAAGAPILAAVPDGDARDMLLSVGTATVCRPPDVDCLADGLRERIVAWREHGPRPRPDPAVLARFEFRRLTGDLAALLDQVVGTVDSEAQVDRLRLPPKAK
jgi:glycosyltransferase involved in cell wall biosynthesis